MNLLEGITGAVGGLLTGGPVGAIAGGIGGLMGGGGGGGGVAGLDQGAIMNAQQQMAQNLQFQTEMNQVAERFKTLSEAQKTIHDAIMGMLNNAH